MNKLENSKLFKYPWLYKEGFIISGVIVVVGLILGVLTSGYEISTPGFPYNLSLIVSYTLLLIVVYMNYRETTFVKWLASVPAAIVSIVLVSFITMLLGIIPQVEPYVGEKDIYYNLGFTHLTTSWLYSIAFLYFTSSLGLSTVKMFFSFELKKIGILLSHVGLYIIIVAAAAGSGDLSRNYFVLYNSDKPTNVVREYGVENLYEMPFYLKLLKFNIKNYNAKLVIVDNSTGYIVNDDKDSHSFAEENSIKKYKNYNIKVVKYLEDAFPTDSTYQLYIEKNEFGSVAAAFIEVIDINNNEKIAEGWVSPGNFKLERKSVFMSRSYSVGLFPPEPKEYSSEVIAFLPDGSEDKFTLKVNQPHDVMGVMLYQSDYNAEKGKWSEYSVIEAGSDPWLPIVYIGIYIMLAGAIYLFWLGRSHKNDVNKLK